ncbi:MAG: YdcF family protein [Patescibacteria group bacterium]|nr:YdcF family protein [Patescibacteria group bacterium]
MAYFGVVIMELPSFNKQEFASRDLEQKELWGKLKFNEIIVFGQGPVKPVLLQDELSDEQKKQWDEFKTNPVEKNEPDFRVLEGDFAERIKGIDSQEDLEKEREKLQRTGRLSLNRWCRSNALASGLTLYLGLTDKVILSGGKTIPAWAKNTLPKERIENWPSEAEMMKDVIIKRYGKIFQEKYGKSIEGSIVVEDASTNTLENLAYTLNNDPDILKKDNKDNKVGLLGADFHLRRIAILAKIFGIQQAPRGELSAQEILRERAQLSNKENYNKMMEYLKNALDNADLRNRILGEERWERGLIDENYIAYWLGYLGKVKDPKVLKQVIICLKNPKWVNEARGVFQKINLDFDKLSEQDLENLPEEEFTNLAEKINIISQPKDKGGLREMPPAIK